MDNTFWRQPNKDDKRWYGTFRAETDGYILRYKFTMSIRGVVTAVCAAAVGTFLMSNILDIASAAVLVIEAIGRGIPV